MSRRFASRYIYQALWTDPQGDSCFSIYQISWIKIRKELFVNKRRHLVRVCLRCKGQCFGDHFVICFKFSEKIFFFYRPVNASKPNFVSLLVFVGTAASFAAKISSFETVAKRESRPKSELREPIRTRENRCSLILWILKMLIINKVQTLTTKDCKGPQTNILLAEFYMSTYYQYYGVRTLCKTSFVYKANLS